MEVWCFYSLLLNVLAFFAFATTPAAPFASQFGIENNSNLLLTSLTLAKLQFLNHGYIQSTTTTTTTTTFEYHPQCGSATEDIHAFKAGANYSYLWARGQHPLQHCSNATDSTTTNKNGSCSPTEAAAAAAAAAPPVGMRSGVPLGGFGTGTVELRADGTFKEYLIENGGPGLEHTYHHSSFAQAKVDADELFVAAYARFQGGTHNGEESNAKPYAATLRANAPHLGRDGAAPALPEVAGLNYSGAYPVARLIVVDPDAPVGIVMHAYSPLQLYNATVRHGAIPPAFNLTRGP